MTLTFKELEFRTEVPEVPRSLPLPQVVAQCAPERTECMRALGDMLGLSELLEVELPFGHALAGEAGQVEFFAASGAVRGRNTKLITSFADERRDWAGAYRTDSPAGPEWTLEPDMGKRLQGYAADILGRAGLLGDGDRQSMDLTLGQWARLDEDGAEVDSGPGRATVRVSYSHDGLPFIGPGAKTLAHFDPVDGQPTLARLFHVHRDVGEVRSVEVAGTEAAFAGLLSDPLLVANVRRHAKVAITSAKLGLLALPADVPQRFALPALAVEGVIEGLQDRVSGPYELRFGRYIQVAASDAVRAAGVVVTEPVFPGRVVRRRSSDGE